MDPPQHGIVLHQMRQSLGVGQIVDRDEFDVRLADASPNHVPADTAEAVDAHFHCHGMDDLLEGMGLKLTG